MKHPSSLASWTLFITQIEMLKDDKMDELEFKPGAVIHESSLQEPASLFEVL